MRTNLFRRFRKTDDRGQGAIEYIGILLVVIVVITAALAGFKAAKIDTKATELIGKVFSAT